MTSIDFDEITTMMDLNEHEPSSPLFDPYYTYSLDKVSCMREFYFVHVVCCYIILLSGIACLLTRILPQSFRWMHSWFGRLYICSMLWATASSLLINNTGLPVATLVGFAVVMIGLSLSWFIIRIYIQNMNHEANMLVQKRLIAKIEKGNNDKDYEINLESMLNQARVDIANGKTFMQRFFSLKTAHGSLFFVTFAKMTGRIFFSNQSGDFTCHTYPVYKPLDTPIGNFANKNMTMVPEHDPEYDRLPWSAGPVKWALQMAFGYFVFSLLVGAIWNYCDVRVARRKMKLAEDIQNSSVAECKSPVDDEVGGNSEETKSQE